ncbi:MAG: DUF349 domain-containing protein [Candidatus Polarisedimenticolia bacterium]
MTDDRDDNASTTPDAETTAQPAGQTQPAASAEERPREGAPEGPASAEPAAPLSTEAAAPTAAEPAAPLSTEAAAPLSAEPAAPTADAQRRRLGDELARLEAKIAGARAGLYVDRVRRLRDAARAAGVEEIADRLDAMERAVLDAQVVERAKKEDLCRRAEELQDSTTWKATAETLKGFREEWKSIGSAGMAPAETPDGAEVDLDEVLWGRFRGALNHFFDRRALDLERRALQRDDAKGKKEALCGRAEALLDSEDWRGAAEAFDALMEEWKAAGSAGREFDEALWKRFGAARAAIFERRAEHYKDLRREQEENRRRKEALVAEAEALVPSEDLAAACRRIRELQAEWKTIGAPPKAVRTELWDRFRAAGNAVFEKANEQGAGANLAAVEALVTEAESLVQSANVGAACRRIRELQAEWKTVGPAPRAVRTELWERFRAAGNAVFEKANAQRDERKESRKRALDEALERRRRQVAAIEESMARDRGHIERWEATLRGLRPGGREDEVRAGLEAKIADVGARLAANYARLEEIKASMADIEARISE